MGKNNRHGQAAILSGNQISKIRKNLSNASHRLLFDVAVYTGERWGAICQLEVADAYANPRKSQPLDYITFRARTRKASPDGTRKTRQVPVHPELKILLESYRAPNSGWLFPSIDGCNHISLSAADKALRRALTKAKLNNKGISTHSTRRTFITKLANSGVGIRTIQKLTGHQDVKTLMKYIEVTPDQEKNAIALLEN